MEQILPRYPAVAGRNLDRTDPQAVVVTTRDDHELIVNQVWVEGIDDPATVFERYNWQPLAYLLDLLHGNVLARIDRETLAEMSLCATTIGQEQVGVDLSRELDRTRPIDQDDFEEHFNRHLLQALVGNIESAVQVGEYFERGVGTNKEPVLAYHYFWWAAKRGHQEAARRLGWRKITN